MMEDREAFPQGERSFPLLRDEYDSVLLDEWRKRDSAEFAVWVVETHIEGRSRAYASDVEAAVQIVASLQRKFPAIFAALAEMRQEVTHV